MDLPQPPADQELKNIIDKLAQFVARNGPEFEHMTKQKQKDNPKFSFLFGGTYFHYYQYRVTTEQAILKQKQRSLEQQALVQQAINRQSIQTAPWQQHLQQMQDTSAEQIRQSEQNLAAQHQLLLQQQQVQVDEVIRNAQEEKLLKLAKDNDLDFKELDGVLQPIIDSCTKDSISTGKGWIFSHASSAAKSEVVILYILKKVTEPVATFEAKLHLVYLINDVIHHCFRKNAEDLKKILERAVVPIFCSTSIGVDTDKQQKLAKLHKLWETNKYFSQQILDQLQNPAASLAAYQAGLIAEYAALITPITASIQTQYSLLQKQHQDFVAHLTGHMQQMQFPSNAMPNAGAPATAMTATPFVQPAFDQSASLTQDPRMKGPEEAPRLVGDASQPLEVPEQEEIKMEEDVVEPEDSVMKGQDIGNPELRNQDLIPSGLGDREPAMGRGHPMDYTSDDMHDPAYGYPDLPSHHPNGRDLGPSHYMDDYSPHYGHPQPSYGGDPPEYGMTPPHMGGGYGRAPYRDVPMGGLGPHDVPPEYMEPPCAPPYYDLPAGLMVPLVKLEDTDYSQPLDPDGICLPPPALPTERLLAAVEQFYCPPTHERRGNSSYVISSEGWEQLGLYEFFKAKAQAKRQKGLPTTLEEERHFESIEDESALNRFNEQQRVSKRRYREFKSPEKEVEEPVKNGDKPEKPHHTRSKSRSRSRSPDLPPRHSSRSPTPPRTSFQRSRGRSRSPDNRKRRSPDRRSVSPPSFVGSSSTPREHRLDESNKGHQLLKKMGWSGAGLGSNEQGIQDPVDAGDVRDRQDMYKGVGVSLNDPYENFRKSKGQAFINRMKARAEELGKN